MLLKKRGTCLTLSCQFLVNIPNEEDGSGYSLLVIELSVFGVRYSVFQFGYWLLGRVAFWLC